MKQLDVVEFFEEVAAKWNEENKCDFCWTFGAPLSVAGMNSSIHSQDSVCCSHLFLTSYKISPGESKHDFTGQVNRAWCDHIFTLYAVQNANLGVNVYNEQIGHPIDASLWRTILKPLLNCLGCGHQFDLCEMGYEFEIFKWSMETVLVKEDSNYTGWQILGIFRQYTQ